MSGYRLFSSLLVFLIILSTMHPVHSYFGFNIKTLFLTTFLTIVALFLLKAIEKPGLYRDDYAALLIGSGVIVLGLLGSLVSGSLHQVLGVLVLATTFFFLYSEFSKILTKTVSNALIYFVLALLIGSVFSLFYALLGGESTFSVRNQETEREIYWYFLSFTNSVLGNIIRPSGLFDEPGAFAMFVLYSTIIIALSHSHSHRHKTELIALLLFMALVTFSLMIVLALILYAFFFQGGKKFNGSMVILLGAITIFGVVLNDISPGLVDKLLFSRFEFSEDGFAGDNRSDQMLLLISELNPEIILKGYQVLYGNYESGDIASGNPLSILFTSGIFAFIPFVMVEGVLIFIGIASRDRYIKYSAFLLFLVLLQRPYIYSLYWGPLTTGVLILILKSYFGKTLPSQRVVNV